MLEGSISGGGNNDDNGEDTGEGFEENRTGKQRVQEQWDIWHDQDPNMREIPSPDFVENVDAILDGLSDAERNMREWKDLKESVDEIFDRMPTLPGNDYIFTDEETKNFKDAMKKIVDL